MVSGASTSTFKSVLAHIDKTPYEFMVGFIRSRLRQGLYINQSTQSSIHR